MNYKTIQPGMTVSDLKYHFNRIRIIDGGSYKEKFVLPDQGRITVISEEGEPVIHTCAFIDDFHFQLDDRWVYHIDQFAETTHKIGAAVEPHYDKADMNASYLTAVLKNGRTVLLSDQRILPGSLPKGCYAYELCYNDTANGGLGFGGLFIEKQTSEDNRYIAMVIASEKLPLKHYEMFEHSEPVLHLSANEISIKDHSQTIRDYMQASPPRKNHEAVM